MSVRPLPRDTSRDTALLELLRERAEQIRISTEAAVSASTPACCDEPIVESPVRKEDFENLKRLADLIELRAKVQQRLKRRRWPLIAAVTGVIAIGSALLVFHTPSTQIEFEGRVRSVRFVLQNEDAILRVPTLTRLGISGLDTIEIPKADTPDWDTFASPERAQLSTEPGGTLTLNSLVLPARTEVVLEIGTGRDCGIELRPPASTSIALAVSIRGGIDFEIDSAGGVAHEVRPVKLPRRVKVQSSRLLRLDLTPSGAGSVAFRPEISVADVSFLYVEQYPDAAESSPRQTSSILSGAVYLESLNGKAVPLRSSERLSFDRSSGILRSVGQAPESPVRTNAQGDVVAAVSPPAFNVQFEGQVSGMSVGPLGARRTLMPTLLAWVSRRGRV